MASNAAEKTRTTIEVIARANLGSLRQAIEMCDTKDDARLIFTELMRLAKQLAIRFAFEWRQGR